MFMEPYTNCSGRTPSHLQSRSTWSHIVPNRQGDSDCDSDSFTNNLLMHLLISLIFYGHVLYCIATGTHGLKLQVQSTDQVTFLCGNSLMILQHFADSIKYTQTVVVTFILIVYNQKHHIMIATTIPTCDTSSNVASVLCQQDELCVHHSYSVHHSFDPALRSKKYSLCCT